MVRRIRVICFLTSIVGFMMIFSGMVIMRDEINSFKVKTSTSSLDVKNMSASGNMIVQEVEEVFYEEETAPLEEVEMETVPASVVVPPEPPRVEVYDGLTFEELTDKLNRNLGSDIVAGYGDVIASECLEKGVDPYITVAIILHETGCGSNCSNLARYCYNFGGQKGSPGCNGGSFKQFDTIEDGLKGLVGNLSKNYFALGLTTPETIGPKYCEGDEWAGHITWFVNKIRNS